jgi:hypothetical protein
VGKLLSSSWDLWGKIKKPCHNSSKIAGKVLPMLYLKNEMIPSIVLLQGDTKRKEKACTTFLLGMAICVKRRKSASLVA